MDNRDARSFLSVHRRGETHPEDSRFAETERESEHDAALAQWWERDQSLDRAIAAKLNSAHVPAGLKERVMPGPVRRSVARPAWSRAILAAAAVIVALAAMFSSWQGPFSPAVSLAEYRDEMVSFIELDPTLAVESAEMPRIKEFLAQQNAPSDWQVPASLQSAEALGCRVLRFRGYDVSLICFEAEGKRLLHLFVVNSAALPRSGTSAQPEFTAEGHWMTATWRDEKHVYILTTEGDRAALEKFIGTS